MFPKRSKAKWMAKTAIPLFYYQQYRKWVDVDKLDYYQRDWQATGIQPNALLMNFWIRQW